MDGETRVKVIVECVKRCEGKYPNAVYDECIEKMKKISLQNVTKEEVEDIIKRFLYVWGRMGRVLGRDKYKDWKGKLLKLIQKYSEKLDDLKKENLIKIELSEFKSEIEELYHEFKDVLGMVAAVKVLHLICPDFFPLWDNDIAKAVGVGKFPKKDYYRFMQEIQNFIKNYDKIFSDLANQYRRNKLRILDEFLWWITREQLSLFY